MMSFLDLFVVASMPVLKVLLLTALGSFLALDRIDVLGENARKQLNNVVFYVFNPAVVTTNLAKTITFESIVLLWFMPFNILFTFIIGSAIGWVLLKITKAPQHQRGLILSCCAAGNMGHLPLIVVPAICTEKGSPFGAPDICHTYGMAYASLSMAEVARIKVINKTIRNFGSEGTISSVYDERGLHNSNLMPLPCREIINNSETSFVDKIAVHRLNSPSIPTVARSANIDGGNYLRSLINFDRQIQYVFSILQVGAIYLWSYAYNIVRVCSSKVNKEVNGDNSTKILRSTGDIPALLEENYSEALLPSIDCSISVQYKHEPTFSCTKTKVSDFDKTWQCLRMIARKLNLEALFAPSTTGAFIGFTIGVIPQIRRLIIGVDAPLHVVQDSASLLGDAAIPIVTLIVGGNLLRGLKGQGICPSLVFGVIAVRYVFLPLLGIVIIKTAVRFGLVHSDPLYQFILLLQYSLPPAMNLGTITQLFKAGESECSVIMLWTYGLASISLTLWSTLFMWLVG